MKYANTQKTAVICTNPTTGKSWTVSRGHRFWIQFGIDKAEEREEIESANPLVMPLEAS